MLKGLGDVGQMMKLQKELKSTQKKLKKKEIEGESKNGLITAVVNGEFKILNINIDKDFLNSGDKDKIEKMILSAINSAIDKSKDYAAQEMKKITGGMNIPGLDNLMK